MDSQYLYSEFMHTPAMMDALMNTSSSYDDAMLRSKEYAKMFSRNNDMQEAASLSGLQKNFSGYAETPLLSTQYFNASVASYVSSFAGYMSIEKDFEQPNGLFYWFDTLGVSDLRAVIPNLGKDELAQVGTVGVFKNEVSVGEGTGTEYTSLIARKIVPGTVRVKVEYYTDDTKTTTVDLIDNGQGKFITLPGILDDESKVNGVNYLAGLVTIAFKAKDSKPAFGNNKIKSINIVGKEDVTGTPCNTAGASNAHANDKRFMAKMNQLALNTVPDMLIAEYNIAALGAMKKATGTDMATFLFNKLRELYTKCINRTLVRTLEEGYIGTTVGDEANNGGERLDLTTNGMAGTFHDYRSRVDLFEAYMVDIEAALTQKAVKGCDISTFVVGKLAANQFQKASIIGKWERNTKMTYINDLLGWYNGIPVLRSEDVDETSTEDVTYGTTETKTKTKLARFYAIHKTKDGQMAPLARGIYMPLTDTPTVGNYNNPTQMAAGIYYQEGIKYLAPELVQRVEFRIGI